MAPHRRCSAGANDAYVQNNLEVGGTLYVDGNSAVTGDMTVSGRITADGITDTADELFQVGAGSGNTHTSASSDAVFWQNVSLPDSTQQLTVGYNQQTDTGNGMALSATGIQAVGTDTDLDLNLLTKGVGNVLIGDPTNSAITGSDVPGIVINVPAVAMSDEERIGVFIGSGFEGLSGPLGAASVSIGDGAFAGGSNCIAIGRSAQ